MKILALDFDGVLVDSRREVLATGFNTYLKVFPHTDLFGAQKISSQAIGKIESQQQETINSFYSLLPYTNDASEVVCAFMAIEEGQKISALKEFDEFRDSVPKEKRKMFMSLFYDSRDELKSDIDWWTSLFVPYDDIVEEVRSLIKEQIKISIVTNRDKKTTDIILPKLGLDITDVLDKDVDTDKLNKLSLIKDRYSAEFSDIVFVDDVLKNLISPHHKQVCCLLAGWGWTGQADIIKAQNQNIPIISRISFGRKIREALS